MSQKSHQVITEIFSFKFLLTDSYNTHCSNFVTVCLLLCNIKSLADFLCLSLYRVAELESLRIIWNLQQYHDFCKQIAKELLLVVRYI